MTDTHYECAICNGINSVSRYTCQHCGTIPAMYSMLASPARRISYHGMPMYIKVFVAYGAERQTSRRTIKRVIRTVPLDYYATE